jgi:hypothetical protein
MDAELRRALGPSFQILTLLAAATVTTPALVYYPLLSTVPLFTDEV